MFRFNRSVRPDKFCQRNVPNPHQQWFGSKYTKSDKTIILVFGRKGWRLRHPFFVTGLSNNLSPPVADKRVSPRMHEFATSQGGRSLGRTKQSFFTLNKSL